MSLLSPLAPVFNEIGRSSLLPFTVGTIHAALSLFTDLLNYDIPKFKNSSKVTDDENFDFIIVGAGTAGCVLANRLTEVSDWKVLLIEAGGDPPLTSVIPGLYMLAMNSPENWVFAPERDENTSQVQNYNRPNLIAGKMLGGSSSVSNLRYYRSKTLTCSDWYDSVWDWVTCRKYYKKLAKHRITRPHKDNEYFTRKEKMLLDAMNNLGHNILSDVNNPEELGYGPAHFFINVREERASSAHTYLLSSLNRNNLFLLKNTLVRKLLFTIDKRVTGVEVSTTSGDIRRFFAIKEVIVSAGTYKSPQLLMLSGIGPAEELNKVNINVRVDLPVGEKLKDVAAVPVFHTSVKGDGKSLETMINSLQTTTFPFPTIVGEFSLKKETFKPDIEHLAMVFQASSPFLYYMCFINYNYNLKLCNSLAMKNLAHEMIGSFVMLKNPESSGNVRLRDRNPESDPIIETGFYSKLEDFERLKRGVKIALQMKNTTFFRKERSAFVNLRLPGCPEEEDDNGFPSDNYLKCYVRQMTISFFMPTGTCRIGPDGVVDGKLKVHGVPGLRVVDASVIPSMVSGELEAMVMMVAERAADLIKDYYGVYEYINIGSFQ